MQRWKRSTGRKPDMPSLDDIMKMAQDAQAQLQQAQDNLDKV